MNNGRKHKNERQKKKPTEISQDSSPLQEDPYHLQDSLRERKEKRSSLKREKDYLLDTTCAQLDIEEMVKEQGPYLTELNEAEDDMNENVWTSFEPNSSLCWSSIPRSSENNGFVQGAKRQVGLHDITASNPEKKIHGNMWTPNEIYADIEESKYTASNPDKKIHGNMWTPNEIYADIEESYHSLIFQQAEAHTLVHATRSQVAPADAITNNGHGKKLVGDISSRNGNVDETDKGYFTANDLRLSNRNLLIVGTCSVFILLASILFLIIALAERDDKFASGSVDQNMPWKSLHKTSFEDSVFRLILSRFPQSELPILDETSPQFRAVHWVTLKLSSDNDVFNSSTSILQQYSLASLFLSTNNDSWYRHGGWLDLPNECDWYGVICGEVGSEFHKKIVSLDLSNNNIIGTIPPEIAILSNSLSTILLSRNGISGTFPSSIEHLTLLRNINLANNALTGSIPTEVAGNMKKMVSLSLSNNMLTGRIPFDIGQASALTKLDLHTNSVSGSIPSEIGLLTNLEILFLNDNLLTSTIPAQISHLTSVTDIDLGYNRLIGPIPKGISSFSNLQTLMLSSTDITGTIPGIMCNFMRLANVTINCAKVVCNCCGCSTVEPCSSFSSISSFGSQLSISSSDYHHETIKLPFLFKWRGEEDHDMITVHANGVLVLGNESENEILGANPVHNGESSLVAWISVAEGDLNPTTGGSIYTAQNSEESYIVSWEGVPHLIGNSINALNFQSILFQDGRVEFRWGGGMLPENSRITAGLRDDSVGMIIPIAGNPFVKNGVTAAGKSPRNQCRTVLPYEGYYKDVQSFTDVIYSYVKLVGANSTD